MPCFISAHFAINLEQPVKELVIKDLAFDIVLKFLNELSNVSEVAYLFLGHSPRSPSRLNSLYTWSIAPWLHR